jgi:hypothetical protein
MKWIDVLNRIPANLHDSLALGLVTGGEVVVQQVIRMENDFVVVRGRMAGSTAEGRVLIVPYSHMTLLAFNKPMPEPEAQELFNNTLAPATRTSRATKVESKVAEPAIIEETPLAEPVVLPEKPASKSGPKPPQSKSILLARLRERLAEKAK